MTAEIAATVEIEAIEETVETAVTEAIAAAKIWTQALAKRA